MVITNSPVHRSPWTFFGLVYLFTVPIWIMSTFVRVGGLPDNLPVTDIGATFVPLCAALILVYREEGCAGMIRLLSRAIDFARIRHKAWYLPILFLMPLLYTLTCIVMRALELPLPEDWGLPGWTPALFVAFFVAAAGEELGYMGYAIDPMQARWGALSASLVIGALWALWHFPSMILIGQSPALMAWGFLATIAFRILYVWLYNNTGKSVFGVILFHSIANTGRSVFPGGRACFELADASVGYSIIVIAAALVAFLWGAKTLARYRYA